MRGSSRLRRCVPAGSPSRAWRRRSVGTTRAIALLLALCALLPPADAATTRADAHAAAIVARQRVADAGTTAAYAPGDPLLFGPAPARFGRPRTIVVYSDGRLAGGWRDLSQAAHTLSVAPPSLWRGRVLRVSFTP